MNLILLEKNDRQVRLKPNDRRVVHIKEVLRMNVGDYLYVGVEGGSIGKALIKEEDEGGMLLEVNTYWESSAPLPVHLLVGLPRLPCRRIVLLLRFNLLFRMWRAISCTVTWLWLCLRI